MSKTAILLSTYNGEKYLTEQIFSILNQTNVDLHLYIRDDGSTDSTINIINKLKSSRDNITFIKGDNIGYKESFIKLAIIAKSDYDYDFYAFCDQDDIWDNNKISLAISYIKNNKPLLYTSSQRVIDENGIILREEPYDIKYKLCKESRIMGLKPRGCTMVWNKSLNNYFINSYFYLKDINFNKDYYISHDKWLYMIANFTGDIVNDTNITMSYRIYSYNTVGTFNNSIKSRIQYIYRKYNIYFKKEKEDMYFWNYNIIKYLEYNKFNVSYIFPYINYRIGIKNKIYLLINKKYYYGMSFRWKLFTKLLILFNKI